MTRQEVIKMLESISQPSKPHSDSILPNSENNMSFVVSANLSLPYSSDVLNFMKNLKSMSFTEKEIAHYIGKMEFHTNEEIADHLVKLMDSRHTNPNAIKKISKLSGSFLRNVRSGKKRISKYTLMGLCFVLKLNKKEVRELLEIGDIKLTKSIPDILFIAFMDKGVYLLQDYVLCCNLLAKEFNVTLDSFFNKVYTNDTI